MTVLSRQGEPLRAIATLESLPEERIGNECLSLGGEADAPGHDAPLLTKAKLGLNAARNAVEISTDVPVSSPTLELVLRVQCPGAFLYARHFAVLVPPATPAITGVGMQKGYRLKVAPGETLASLAAAVAPGNRRLQKQLVREVIAANPQLFPGGAAAPIPAGTVLWFPDLRSLAARSPAAPAPATAKPRPAPPRATAAASATPQPVAAAEPRRPRAAAAGSPVKLRQALELGEKPGAAECRVLVPLCGALEAAAPPAAAPELEHRANGLEAGMQSLRLKQDSIDQQLARLEQSLQDLRKVVESRPAPAVTPAPVPPPRPEVRTVVKTEYRTEPVPWYLWLGGLVLALAAAAGGFLYGRKRAYGDALSASDDRLDAMLASAADEMRELDAVPAISRPVRTAPPPSMRDTQIADIRRDADAGGNGAPEPPSPRKEVPDIAFDTQMMEAATNVDLELDSGSKPAGGGESVPGVTSDLAFEMDQALDNTRSMFTDVDRFIALGRTQNALSLLQFQVVKDPKDRDSWIKLLAIYRQEKMDAELEKALREFRQHFPNDKAAQS
ncbi:MAG TPA: hypothetical protein VHA15_04645 [Burkholderiales bacterium]|nr:hypothetical protein [Burkholderiales bacterium]